jgi:hypothetical protein
MSRKRPRDGRLRLRVLSDDDHAGGCKSVWRDLKVVGRRLVLEDASSQVESRAVTWADKARVSTELGVFIRGKRTVRRAAQVRTDADDDEILRLDRTSDGILQRIGGRWIRCALGAAHPMPPTAHAVMIAARRSPSIDATRSSRSVAIVNDAFMLKVSQGRQSRINIPCRRRRRQLEARTAEAMRSMFDAWSGFAPGRALWIDASSHDNLMSAHRHSHRSTFAHHSHLCIRPQRQNDRRPPAARIRFRFIAISATNSRLAWLPTAPTAANVGGGQAGLPRTR